MPLYISTGKTEAPTEITIPGAPTDVSVIPGNTELYVSWLAPFNNGGSAISGYDLSYRVEAGVWQTLNFGVQFNTLITGLVNGTLYEVRVKANNAIGTSAWSIIATGTPNYITVPAAPATPTLDESVPGSISIDWLAPSSNGGSAITGYTVRWRVGVLWTELSFASNVFTTTLSSVLSGTTYEVEVRASNAIGPGAWSNTASILTAGTSGPTYIATVLTVGENPVQDPIISTASQLSLTLTVSSPSPTVNRLQYQNPPENEPATQIVLQRSPSADVYVQELNSTSFDFLNLTTGSSNIYAVRITGPAGTLVAGPITWLTGSSGSASDTGGLEDPPPDPGVQSGRFFTGTFPDSFLRATTPGITPVLVGGSPKVVANVGTFTAVSGGITFDPVEKFPIGVVASTGYTVSGGATQTMEWEFDPFYWDGPLPRASAPTANATVAPSGLQAAINAASAGQVIHVTDGTHATRITVNKTLTLWAVNKWGPKFSAGFDVPGANVVIDGIEVTNAAANTDGVSITGTNPILRHVKVSTPSGRQNLLLGTGGAHNALIESCEFWKPDGTGYSMSYTLDSTAGFGNEARNVVCRQVNNVTFRNCKLSGSLQRGIVFEDCNTILMEHCWIEKTRSKTVYAIGCLDVRYINNRVFNGGDAGLQVNECFETAGGTGCDISYNTVWTNVPMATDRLIDPISIFRSGGSATKKFTISKNRTWQIGATNVGSGGMTGDGGGGHQEFVENVCVNPGQTGFGIYGGANIAMRRNKLFADHPNTVAGGGSVGMYIWIGPSHLDTVGGRTYGRGSHIWDANKVYFRRPDGSLSNTWIENQAMVIMNTNILGSVGNSLGMSANSIYEF